MTSPGTRPSTERNSRCIAILRNGKRCKCQGMRGPFGLFCSHHWPPHRIPFVGFGLAFWGVIFTIVGVSLYFQPDRSREFDRISVQAIVSLEQALSRYGNTILLVNESGSASDSISVSRRETLVSIRKGWTTFLEDYAGSEFSHRQRYAEIVAMRDATDAFLRGDPAGVRDALPIEVVLASIQRTKSSKSDGELGLWSLRIWAEYVSGNYDEVVSLLALLEEKYPSSPAIMFMEVDSYLKTGRIEEARGRFNEYAQTLLEQQNGLLRLRVLSLRYELFFDDLSKDDSFKNQSFYEVIEVFDELFLGRINLSDVVVEELYGTMALRLLHKQENCIDEVSRLDIRYRRFLGKPDYTIPSGDFYFFLAHQKQRAGYDVVDVLDSVNSAIGRYEITKNSDHSLNFAQCYIVLVSLALRENNVDAARIHFESAERRLNRLINIGASESAYTLRARMQMLRPALFAEPRK